MVGEGNRSKWFPVLDRWWTSTLARWTSVTWWENPQNSHKIKSIEFQCYWIAWHPGNIYCTLALYIGIQYFWMWISGLVAVSALNLWYSICVVSFPSGVVHDPGLERNSTLSLLDPKWLSQKMVRIPFCPTCSIMFPKCCLGIQWSSTQLIQPRSSGASGHTFGSALWGSEWLGKHR